MSPNLTPYELIGFRFYEALVEQLIADRAVTGGDRQAELAAAVGDIVKEAMGRVASLANKSHVRTLPEGPMP
jgi:hypothetical protein